MLSETHTQRKRPDSVRPPKETPPPVHDFANPISAGNGVPFGRSALEVIKNVCHRGFELTSF